MIGTRLRWSGDRRFVAKMLKRAQPGELERAVFRPWSNRVKNVHIIEMFKEKGAVPGPDGQPPWKKLSKWAAITGGPAAANLILLSPRQYQFGTMVRSYKITSRPKGKQPGSWYIEIENTKKSSSGFDYPSALHNGWRGRGRIYPKAGSALAIPIFGFIGGKQGRGAGGRFTGKSKGKTGRTGTMIFASVKKGSAPPRPHIRFYGRDGRLLMEMTRDYILEGRA